MQMYIFTPNIWAILFFSAEYTVEQVQKSKPKTISIWFSFIQFNKNAPKNDYIHV